MTATDALERIGEARLVAVVRGASARDAVAVADALMAGGVTAVEITFTTPNAPSAIAALAAEYGQEVVVGAGTVTAAAQAEQAAESGATFLVSPGFDARLAERMRATSLAVLPGAITPSEVMAAAACGLTAVKLFPGSLGGPGHLESLRAPFPAMRFVPTGGVSLENLDAWFAAGAFAVGAGGSLAPARLADDRHRSAVIKCARRFTERLGALAATGRTE